MLLLTYGCCCCLGCCRVAVAVCVAVGLLLLQSCVAVAVFVAIGLLLLSALLQGCCLCCCRVAVSAKGLPLVSVPPVSHHLQRPCHRSTGMEGRGGAGFQRGEKCRRNPNHGEGEQYKMEWLCVNMWDKPQTWSK